jgi:ribosomal protein L11 methyltransferase
VNPGGAREEALAALFAAGAQGVQEDGDALVTHFPPDSDLDAIRGALIDAAPNATIQIDTAPSTDWSEAWKTQLHAHVVGSLTVAPPWLAGGLDPARSVVIEPAMAFGTGDHATTRGVIRLLHAILRQDDFVADLGAGSAILSIAAVKLGAKRAIAIEIDPDAIGNATENVDRNGVAARVAIVEGVASILLPLVAPVDCILANIISSVLQPLLPAMRAALAPGGRIVLSGILGEERAEMLAVLDAGLWKVIAEDSEDVWWSVAAEPR